MYFCELMRKTKDLSQLKNLFATVMMLSTILSFIIVISGCNHPAHGPAIEGDVKISRDSKGDLCFMPIFSSATLMENPTDLKYINMIDLDILDLNAEDANSKIIRIKPKSKKYFILKEGERVCLNTNNPELEQFVYIPLNNQELLASIGGLDDKKELVISFQKEFNYPYVFE